MAVGEITVTIGLTNTPLTFVPAVGTVFVSLHMTSTSGWCVLGTTNADSLLTNNQNTEPALRVGITNACPLWLEGRVGNKCSFSVLQME